MLRCQAQSHMLSCTTNKVVREEMGTNMCVKVSSLTTHLMSQPPRSEESVQLCGYVKNRGRFCAVD